MLLVGFAGGPRRSEIVGLDVGRDQTEDGRSWIDILDKGSLVTRAASPAGARSRSAVAPRTRHVAVESWIKSARIAKGPLFRRVRGQGKDVGMEPIE